MMHSIWTQTSEETAFQPLKGNRKTDVLIIGGGIAGVLCAYMLKQAGVDCLLVEADRIGCGITKNTTAKITLQHGLIYDRMIRRFGLETATLYREAQQTAMAKYRALCQNIACDYEELDSYVYSLGDRRAIERETAALNAVGCRASLVESLPLPFSVAGAVRVEKQAQFHPLKFLYTVAKGLPIFEQTEVIELRPEGAVTRNGVLSADHIVVATHFPFLNKHGSYYLKLYQHRSYVIALENAQKVNGMYVDESKTGLSFRNYGDLLLLGGGSHRTGKQGGNWKELTEFAHRHYRNGREVCRWATQDCMTLDDIPYIGRYSKRTKNLYVATGFNKWGMTSSMAAAMILTDEILGKRNAYAPIFSPSRSILRPQLAVNAAESLVGLLTPKAPRCPHLGCALRYNPQERSWDCSCHGSRFTKEGKRIDNPSTGDLKRFKDDSSTAVRTKRIERKRP